VNTVVSSAMVMEINFFNSFVLNVDLLDVTPFGRKFTWHHSNGLAMSRIDMALFSEGWNRYWGSASFWLLPRTISDHCPLVL